MDYRGLKISIFSFILGMIATGSAAEESREGRFNEVIKASQIEFDSIVMRSRYEFEQLRRKANDEFARAMSLPWESVKVLSKSKPSYDFLDEPFVVDTGSLNAEKPMSISITKVISAPQPARSVSQVEMIREIKCGNEMNERVLRVKMYGTEFSFRISRALDDWYIMDNTLGGWTNAYIQLNNDSTNNLILDCLTQKEEKNLCDWAYLKLLQLVGKTICKRDNEATILTGFLLAQSGYTIRFARGSKNTLHLLFCSKDNLYEKNGRHLKCEDDNFYFLGTPPSDSCKVMPKSNFKYPFARYLSLNIDKPIKFAKSLASSPKEITLNNYPELKFKVSVNKNLIHFYNDYPECDPYTRWIFHANAPVSEEIECDLYQPLREIINGKSQKDAVRLLLNLVQSFKGKEDKDVWERDRTFFVDESWYYEFSDCEDHAVHFSRLVRDLVGLDVILVFFPPRTTPKKSAGHLATAVVFDESVTGVSIEYRGKRFILCDPTAPNADIGVPMQHMKIKDAIIVDLQL